MLKNVEKQENKMKQLMVETSGIEPLKVEPVARILKEVAVRVSKDICPLVGAAVDDIWAIPHGFELPFSQLIIGLVVNKD